MATITKKELIDKIADTLGEKRGHVKRIVHSFLDAIVEELGNGNRLEFRDFGVFESRMRASRDAQNPKTLDKVHVPSKRTVKFKIGRIMKRRLHETPATIDAATGLAVEASADPRKLARLAKGDGLAGTGS
jgi:nucleoid DNA-binding protein